VAFGITGVLWSLRPTLFTIKQMSGEATALSVVPGLVAVAIGALSGLASSGAPPTGGSMPPVWETGFKRSKFSADETIDLLTGKPMLMNYPQVATGN